MLIAGGENVDSTLNKAGIFDPGDRIIHGGWKHDTRAADHVAVIAADGRLFISGGRDAVGAIGTTEFFDPTSGTFTSGPAMSVACDAFC